MITNKSLNRAIRALKKANKNHDLDSRLSINDLLIVLKALKK